MTIERPPHLPEHLDALQRKKLLSNADAQRVQSLCQEKSISSIRAMLALGVLEEPILLEAAASVLGIPLLGEISSEQIDNAAIAKLTIEWCHSRRVLPIVPQDGARRIVVADPEDTPLIEEIYFFLGEQSNLAVAPAHVIREALKATDSFTDQRDDALPSDFVHRDARVSDEFDQDGPVKRFVDEVFETAVSKGASDVHFEAQKDGLRIRLRKNGLLSVLPSDPSLLANAVFARVKVLAEMNVSQRRLPQDGRITRIIGGRSIDFRVSSVPTSYGESIVCRILDPKSLRLGWAQLGFDEATSKQIRDIVEQPSGLFLVTGPTGSGKTTTLYTALNHLNETGCKIITIEDPIEYNLDGVEQVQVHEEVGMSFAVALRAFLRQDPNVIMVGEIRDQETAEIACRAALVGRMVLSTLHTNSAQGAVTRLLDLGVPKFVVRDVLRGVLGQRLEPLSGGKITLKYNILGEAQMRSLL